MRLFLLFAASLWLPLSLAAAPANDHFASRISLAGNSQRIHADSIDATVEPGENTQNSYFGATVWWSWLAPVNGWARISTAGSSFDTVVQISTGSTLATQSYLGFNRHSPDPAGGGGSSITFPITSNTTYNIAVGGWDFFGAENGDLVLDIMTGTAATPRFFPTTLTLTPPDVDVTTGAVAVNAAFTIGAAGGAAGTGSAEVGFGWEHSFGDGPAAGPPAAWDTALPQSGSPQLDFTVPRYRSPGDHMLWFKIRPSTGIPLIFSGPDGGSGYALPPSVARSLTVANAGPVDEDPPSLTAFALTPDHTDVTTGPVSLQITASLTDAVAGVASVQVSLVTASVRIVASLSRSSGTELNGTWTGTLTVPRLFPGGNYSVLVECADAGGYRTAYGVESPRVIPGGNLYVPVIGGAAYEEWAYYSWFAPEAELTGALDDADGDGRSNLLSYAFDLNPRDFRLSAGRLPAVTVAGTGSSQRLRVTFLRRKPSAHSGLTYAPQFTSSVHGIWQTVSDASVTDLGGDWEQVVVEDPVSLAEEPRRFARVKVDYAAP